MLAPQFMQIKIDRSWIYNSLPFTEHYKAGVEKFMQHVRSRFTADEKIKCPCRRCLNHVENSQDEVEEDIHINAMSRIYTRWIEHGEGDDNDVDQDGGTLAIEQDMSWDGNDQAPIDDEVQGEDVIEDCAQGVQGLIQDLYTTASHGHDGNLYKEIIEETKRELYPGCTEESRLSFIIKLLHIKVYNQIPNSRFDAILQLLLASLKNVPGLPKSYNETKALLWKMGFGYVSIHVCKYGCALFWKDHEEDDHCPICGYTKLKVNKESRKKVPHKVLRYFPITPRLLKLFISKQWAKYARWHKE